MKPHTFVLSLVLAFSFFQTPEGHSPSAVKSCTPGVSFWNLLDEVRVGHTDGRLGIGRIYAVCLPTPAKQSTSNYPYDPDGGGKLVTLVKSADGKVLNTYVWYAESIGGLWEMSRYKVLGGYESVKPLATGNYMLEFVVEDKPFYRFPFSVVSLKNEDPYSAAGNRYFIEGAWNDYGNIYYQRNDPQSSLTFTVWVQDKVGQQNQTSVPYQLKLVNTRSGRVVGVGDGSLRPQPRWLKAGLYFRPSGGDKNAYLRAGELLREDGPYQVELTLNNKLYGTYPFVVKAGRIELQGKQIREKTDPMSYIVDYLSGGRYTSWWIKRE